MANKNRTFRGIDSVRVHSCVRRIGAVSARRMECCSDRVREHSAAPPLRVNATPACLAPALTIPSCVQQRLRGNSPYRVLHPRRTFTAAAAPRFRNRNKCYDKTTFGQNHARARACEQLFHQPRPCMAVVRLIRVSRPSALDHTRRKHLHALRQLPPTLCDLR